MASRLHKIQHKIRKTNLNYFETLYVGVVSRVCLLVFVSAISSSWENIADDNTMLPKSWMHRSRADSTKTHFFSPVLCYWVLARRLILYDIFLFLKKKKNPPFFLKKKKSSLFFLVLFLSALKFTFVKALRFLFQPPSPRVCYFWKNLLGPQFTVGYSICDSGGPETLRNFLVTRYFPPSFLSKALLPWRMINFSQGQESPSRAEPEVRLKALGFKS